MRAFMLIWHLLGCKMKKQWMKEIFWRNPDAFSKRNNLVYVEACHVCGKKKRIT
jgi:hypothetical protein